MSHVTEKIHVMALHLMFPSFPHLAAEILTGCEQYKHALWIKVCVCAPSDETEDALFLVQLNPFESRLWALESLSTWRLIHHWWQLLCTKLTVDPWIAHTQTPQHTPVHTNPLLTVWGWATQSFLWAPFLHFFRDRFLSMLESFNAQTHSHTHTQTLGPPKDKMLAD